VKLLAITIPDAAVDTSYTIVISGHVDYS